MLTYSFDDVYVRTPARTWRGFKKDVPTAPGQLVYSRATGKLIGVVVKLSAKKCIVTVDQVMLWRE